MLKENVEQLNNVFVNELRTLGIEANKQNLEVVAEMKKVSQCPDDYEQIFTFKKQEELIAFMQEKKLKSIIHFEGLTVWDHVKKTLEEVDSLALSDEKKAELKLIMLYHDLGKIEVSETKQNQQATQKNIKKGKLLKAMTGHATARQNKIKTGFIANGITEQRANILLVVIRNHMNTSLLTQSPVKLVKLFSSFGKNDTDKQEVVKLLINVLQLDSDATLHVNLKSNKLISSQKVTPATFEEVWSRYEKGLQEIKDQKNKKLQEKIIQTKELLIFDKGVYNYVFKERNIQPHSVGMEAVKKIESIILENHNLTPEQLKKIIDNADLI